ncbi:Ionotropic glutamate receptor [Parasponia andersonii]|uniref:Glutamate receptor n=1 Tax=Parasponia andersonii TaxID=3476 RepID=A0A2P5B1S5_PARAD|nr:Ionotropic glutamate receptor [Parasponia andersonii]
MKDKDIHAIIGPERSMQAKFVISLGEKARVPIISFSATSPSVSPTHNPFFIRTTQDDSSQVQAIASIVQKYGWREVVLIYEDTEYGNGLIPYLTDAFQHINTQVSYRSVISPSTNSNYQVQIAKELSKIMARETRVLVVHMIASLGSELFRQAAEIGMMSEGFAWIITDGLSTLLDPVSKDVTLSSMQGVLGVRPHVPMSKGLKDFKMRYFNTIRKNANQINLFGLWAYDTIWALAKAVESVGKMNISSGSRKNIWKNGSEPFGLVRVSKFGPMLLETLERTKFRGLSGKFHLKGRQLQHVAYEIFNMIGKREKVVGYWRADKGTISHDLAKYSSNTTSMKNEVLKAIAWPGLTRVPPKGWVIPLVGQKLKIGVPVTNGFKEFFQVKWDPLTDEPTFSGLSYDIFLAALDKLPFAVPCEFIPYANSSREMLGTYDELVYQIKLEKYDAVVGDVTINANRTSYVDFTLPYSESGISMVVKIKEEEKNIWIFLKPLSWDLWLTTGGAFIFTGFVVWVFEHRTNTEFRGPPNQQLGTVFWFSFSTLVFAHREKVKNNWSRLVLIIWIFVVLILTQSYTASLASMLTVQRLQPAVVDVNELKRNGDFVGYSSNSFVRGFLIEQLNFNESKLRPYSTPKEYHDALSKGSKQGGVVAIFDEIPYIKLFLARYRSQYTMVGPTYKSDGFGFAFPLGSPLVSYISRAILKVTEDHIKMRELEQKYLGDPHSGQDQGSKISSDGSSLNLYSFGGLFIITGLATGFSFLIFLVKFHRKHWPAVNASHSESSIWSRVATMAKHFDNRVAPLHDSNNRTESNAGAEVLPINNSNFQNHSTHFSQDVEMGASANDEQEDNHNFQNHSMASFSQNVETTVIDEQEANHSIDARLFINGGS